MSEQTQQPQQTGQYADIHPGAWIAVGVLFAVVGTVLVVAAAGEPEMGEPATGNHVLQALGFLFAGCGSIPVLIGTIALGVELGLSRSRR